jgi:hypothetical protein
MSSFELMEVCGNPPACFADEGQRIRESSSDGDIELVGVFDHFAFRPRYSEWQRPAQEQAIVCRRGETQGRVLLQHDVHLEPIEPLVQ